MYIIPYLSVNSEQSDLQKEQINFPEPHNPQFKTDLREFLSHDADGRTILDVYRRQKQLSEPMSRLLSRTIIRREKHRIIAKLDPGAQLEKFVYVRNLCHIHYNFQNFVLATLYTV
jgi:hypothetical protein